jgi:ATPase subunit of ABC transporter with duplicated ATPase domains
MSDLDYGALKTFPGNYDDFMIAATAIQEKMQSDNAKKEAKMKELKKLISFNTCKSPKLLLKPSTSIMFLCSALSCLKLI